MHLHRRELAFHQARRLRRFVVGQVQWRFREDVRASLVDNDPQGPITPSFLNDRTICWDVKIFRREIHFVERERLTVAATLI